jgi:predicted TIM-barrel fold metal-dependent hydrolase
MSAIVDVDSHWTFPYEFRIDQGPLRTFASELPDEGDLFAFFIAGDLLRSLSADERPTADQLFPTRQQPGLGETHVPPRFEGNRLPSLASDRLEWMDRIGIGYALVNSGSFPAAFPLIADDKARRGYIRACNDELAGALDGHADRLGAVTYADLTDLDGAIAELTRMRAAGSRAFSIIAEPVGGRSLGHPHFDRLWSAVTDLGMIVSVHTGLAPAMFGDWGRLGLDFAQPDARGRLLRMANVQRHQAVELILTAMVFGGVFERHPKLTVLVAELNLYWLPGLISRLEMFGSWSDNVFGPWLAKESPADILRRQVRASPLPGLGDLDALDVLEALPDMIVFSSDYPHSEGNADPVALYGPRLNSLPAKVHADFMGSTIRECFARMGDPVTA